MEDENTIVCSNCKREIPAANADLHLSHCRRHLTLCTKCDEPVPVKSLAQHIAEDHREINCEKCSCVIEEGREEEHRSECTHEEITCMFCNLPVKRFEHAPHDDACGARTELCELCGARVMLRDLEVHTCGVFPSRNKGKTTSPYSLRPHNDEEPIDNSAFNGNHGSTNTFDGNHGNTNTFDDNHGNSNTYGIHGNGHFLGDDYESDYLDELIETDHMKRDPESLEYLLSEHKIQEMVRENEEDPYLLNASELNLDEALAAQLAHDLRQEQPIWSEMVLARVTNPLTRLTNPITNPPHAIVPQMMSHQRVEQPRVTQPDLHWEVPDTGSEDLIPCEFCGSRIAMDELILHESGCMAHDISTPAQIYNADPEEFKIPCEFCARLYPFTLIAQHQAGCTPTRHPPTFSDILHDERPINPSQNPQQFGATSSNLVPNRTVHSPTSLPAKVIRPARPVKLKKEVKPTRSTNAVPVGGPLTNSPTRSTVIKNGATGSTVRNGATGSTVRSGPSGSRAMRNNTSNSLPGAMNNLDKPSPAVVNSPMTVFVPAKKTNKGKSRIATGVSVSSNEQTTTYRQNIRKMVPKTSNNQPQTNNDQNTENVNIVGPNSANKKSVNEKSFKFDRVGNTSVKEKNKKEVLDRYSTNTTNGATNGASNGAGPSSRDKTFVVQSSKKRLVKKKENTFVVEKD